MKSIMEFCLEGRLFKFLCKKKMKRIMEFCLEGRRFKFLCKKIVLDEDGELDIDSLVLMECVKGKGVKFEIKGNTFSGRKLDVYDVLNIEINRFTRMCADQKMIYMHKKIKAYINKQLPNRETIEIGGKKYPKSILHGFYSYNMLFATDKYVHYSSFESGEFVMFDMEMALISDNYFAECGFFESIEAVAKGEEKIHYISEIDRDFIEERLREEGWKEQEEG